MTRTSRYLFGAAAAALLVPVLSVGAYAADDPTPAATTDPTPSVTATPSTTPTPSSTPTPSTTPTPKPTKTTPAAPTQATTAARNITITKVSATSAKLTWSDPSDKVAGETVHYYVKTTIKLGGVTTSAPTQANTTAHSITYSGLQPGSVLRPEVTTVYRHDKGRHDYGSSYTVKQVKPDVVTGVGVTVIDHSKKRAKPDVSVTFAAPNQTGSKGTLVDKYRVRLYNVDTKKKVLEKIVTDPAYIFEKVDYKTGYYVTVEAHNSAGYGKAVTSKSVITPIKVIYPSVQIPLPKIPGSVVTKPTKSTPTPTATATPTPTPSATAAPGVDVTTGFDQKQFVLAAGIAGIVGVILGFGTFAWYRRHPWKG